MWFGNVGGTTAIALGVTGAIGDVAGAIVTGGATLAKAILDAAGILAGMAQKIASIFVCCGFGSVCWFSGSVVCGLGTVADAICYGSSCLSCSMFCAANIVTGGLSTVGCMIGGAICFSIGAPASGICLGLYLIGCAGCAGTMVSGLDMLLDGQMDLLNIMCCLT